MTLPLWGGVIKIKTMEQDYIYVHSFKGSGDYSAKIPYDRLKPEMKKAYDNNIIWGFYFNDTNKVFAEDIWGNVYSDVVKSL